MTAARQGRPGRRPRLDAPTTAGRSSPRSHGAAAPGPGVLALHGLSGNPASLADLADELADHAIPTEVPRLPGHGTRPRDLYRASLASWRREARTALGRLPPEQPRVVVGLSMGACLAVELASANPVEALVLINPAMGAPPAALAWTPWLRWLLPALPGIGNDIRRPGRDERPYSLVPLAALARYEQLQRDAIAAARSVTCPVWVLASRLDRVVAARSAAVVASAVSSDELHRVTLEHSGHVATLDYDADQVTQAVLAAVERAEQGAAAGSPRVAEPARSGNTHV